MHRVFLDANVLWSASYKAGSRLLLLWSAKATLITSEYAVDEALRNAGDNAHRARLCELLAAMEIITSTESPLPTSVSLVAKDRPILMDAMASRATHLLTGGKEHFGHLFGRTIAGVLVLRPADYLAVAEKHSNEE